MQETTNFRQSSQRTTTPFLGAFWGFYVHKLLFIGVLHISTNNLINKQALYFGSIDDEVMHHSDAKWLYESNSYKLRNWLIFLRIYANREFCSFLEGFLLGITIKRTYGWNCDFYTNLAFYRAKSSLALLDTLLSGSYKGITIKEMKNAIKRTTKSKMNEILQT